VFHLQLLALLSLVRVEEQVMALLVELVVEEIAEHQEP
jgi:hypothetical protein